MASMTGNKDWARSVEARYAKGAIVPRIAVDWASEVLGRPLLRGGKHQRRPDVMDKQAGDTSHADREERVAI